MPTDAWWAWLLLFLGDDLAYYWFHRISHVSRFFWASHIVHHSSQHFNLSTALRQTWVPMTYLPFWLPLLLLGFPPWMVLLAQSWSLIYQFGLHTERIGRLPWPLEAVFNTPSHHRVHHGANEQYLDRNYAGILIIWDRLFGTFIPESERVRYGLTKNITTFNPVRVAFGEYAALARDLRAAKGWRLRLQVALRGPGLAAGRARVNARRWAVGVVAAARRRCSRSEAAVPKPARAATASTPSSLCSSSRSASATRCSCSQRSGVVPVSARKWRANERTLQPAWAAISTTVSGCASRSSAHARVAARPPVGSGTGRSMNCAWLPSR